MAGYSDLVKRGPLLADIIAAVRARRQRAQQGGGQSQLAGLLQPGDRATVSIPGEDPIAAKVAGPAGGPGGNDMAVRRAELMGSGLTQDQAMEQMAREGSIPRQMIPMILTMIRGR